MRVVPIAAATERQRHFLRVVNRSWLRPEREAASSIALLEKLDLNRATPEEIMEFADIDAATATAVARGRPYYSMMELYCVPGVDAAAFGRMSEVFSSPAPLRYTDKLTGEWVNLIPDFAEVIVKATEAEAAGVRSRAESLGLIERYCSERQEWQNFAVRETETGVRPIHELKLASPPGTVLPSFMSGGGRRYLDPRFCAVQFHAFVTRQEAQAVVQSLGLMVYRTFRTPGLYIVEVPGAALDPGRLAEATEGLTSRSEVHFAEPCFFGFDDFKPDLHLHPVLDSQLETASVPWHLDLVHAGPASLQEIGSRTVVVAIIDTGIDADHPAIRDAVISRLESEDWNFDSDFDAAPVDNVGHGTFVAGMVVGNGQLGISGVSPGVSLLPLKVPTTGSIESYARRRDAILYALAWEGGKYPLVINLSWKTSGDIGLIREAIARAHDADAVVVASAGNWPSRESEPHFPSDYQTVVSVGAVGRHRERATYSFYGTEVDLAAPGGSGGSDLQDNLISATLDGLAAYDFGTSFAAPLVAGTAALLRSADPSLTAVQIRTILESTAQSVGVAGLGAGLVDAAAAVTAVSTSVPPSSGEGALHAINTLSAEQLIATYGLFTITAALIVARRPYASLSEIQSTLGLTPEQFALIAERTSPIDENSPTRSGTYAIDANSAPLESLASIPGMPLITARLIIAHRPITSINDLLAILGMTPAVVSYLTV